MTTAINDAPTASEHAMLTSLYSLSGAGASVIQIRTREPLRAALALRKSILATKGNEHTEWDIINGTRTFTLHNYDNHARGEGKAEDLHTALTDILTNVRNPSSAYATAESTHYHVFIDPHPYLAGNPMIGELVLQLANILPTSGATIVFVTDHEAITNVPQGTILTIDLDTPTVEELASSLKLFIERTIENNRTELRDASPLSDEEATQLGQIGRGMSLFEFETHAAVAVLAGIQAGEPDISIERLRDGLTAGKTEVVRQSEILELTQPGPIEDVGGMDNLKLWLEKRKNSYSDEAREFGIEAPKGFALVGVPGTGKSLVAKAVSSIFGIPMVRLDFSRVFSKFVGDSEARVRAALKMVESMAPCVLFVDEIDKGLGGADGSGGDSGTSSRVLGSFLTWLQDHKHPIFTLVTANRTNGLPPELLRRGRFAQVFSVGLPDEVDRLAVLYIHLRKRGRTMKFTYDEETQFAAASSGFVPAEIEAAVQDAIIEAFHEEAEELDMTHIIKALGEIVPMSVSNKERIEAIVAWASKNASPVATEKKMAREERTVRTGARALRPRPRQ